MKHFATTDVLDKMRSSINNWIEPHITYDECDDTDTLEWWKGTKSIVVWIKVDGTFEGLRVWGININTEMSSFQQENFEETYDWMLQQ